MAKHKGGAPAPQTTNDETSWLDGKEETKVTPALVKVLSLRPGDIVIQDGRVLKYHKTLDVLPETYEWLTKTFPGLIERL